MVFLRSISYNKPEGKEPFIYPLSIPLLRDFHVMEFNTPVTLLVGDNGSGKSTLLEIISSSVNGIRIADKELQEDEEFRNFIEVSKFFKLSFSIKNKKGFFLRAEDFINYTRNFGDTRKKMQQEIEDTDERFKNNSPYARSLAKLPYYSSLYQMDSMYEGQLNEKSHGESFLEFFRSRLKPDGLYILDEPEAPLSPYNQIALMTIIKEMVKRNCQFIISTHSPMLMAYKDATIYELKGSNIDRVKYEEIESIKILKSFINNPDKYLRYLED